MKPLSRLASASVTRSQRLVKTTHPWTITESSTDPPTHHPPVIYSPVAIDRSAVALSTRTIRKALSLAFLHTSSAEQRRQEAGYPVVLLTERCPPATTQYMITLSLVALYIVEADSLNASKNRLDKYWTNQDVIYEYL